MAKQPIGIPVKILHESEGSNITILLSNNYSYTGKAEFIDDFMNITLSNVIERNPKNNEPKELTSVFIKGNEIVSVVLPKELSNSPSIKSQDNYLASKKKRAVIQTKSTKKAKLSK